MVRCRDVVKVSGGGLAGMLGCWAAGLGWRGGVDDKVVVGSSKVKALCCYAAAVLLCCLYYLYYLEMSWWS